MTDLERFQAHASECQECRDNPFGLCQRGFALLGRAARIRDEGNQLEFHAVTHAFEERPLVRLWFQQHPPTP